MTNSKATRPTITFLILAVGAAAFAMLQSLLSPVLTTLQTDLHTSRSAISWVLIAWMLSASVATPILGRVGDMAGKSRIVVFGLIAIAVGSLIAALAPNLELVIVGRVVQGLGGAIFPLSYGIIRDEFPAERVPSAVGIMSAIIAVGGGLGTVLAGPVVDIFGWRGLFWLPMLAVLIVAALVRWLVPESPVKTGGRINWLAAGLLGGWLLALLVPLSQGSVWGWSSPSVIGLFALAIILAAIWIWVEFRSDNPVIDMRMMRLTAVWTTNLVALLLGAAMFAVYAFLPMFAQVPASTGYGFGASVSDAGLVMLPMLATMAIAGVFSGPIATRLGFKTQLLWGSALIALSCLGLGLFHTGLWELAAESGLFGVGLGLAYASMTSVIVQNVPQSQTGVATGMNTNIRTIGGTIGTAIMTSVVTGAHQADGLPLETGFTNGFLLFAAVGLAAVAVSLLIPGRRPAPQAVAVAT
jgi:MFS family permease